MSLHRGRVLGIIMGLVILVAIFLIPFGTGSSTLYGQVGPVIGNIAGVQSSGYPAQTTYDYVLIVAFIILVIAGVVGLFPLGTGVLGVVAMAMLSVAPSLIFPNGPVKLEIGAGFIVVWAASIISLGGSFWHPERKQVVVMKQGTSAPPQPASTDKPKQPEKTS